MRKMGHEPFGSRFAGGSCNMPVGSVTIGADYLAANEPVVKEQLQKAGVRLARVLDAAFGN